MSTFAEEIRDMVKAILIAVGICLFILVMIFLFTYDDNQAPHIGQTVFIPRLNLHATVVSRVGSTYPSVYIVRYEDRSGPVTSVHELHVTELEMSK